MCGADFNIAYSLWKTALVFTGKNRERQTKLSRANMLTLRGLLWDGRFESGSHTLLRKLDFFLGDSIDKNEEVLYDGNYN